MTTSIRRASREHPVPMNHIPTFDVERRGGPLLISMPHLGTAIPDDLRNAYSPEALTVADTDWHLEKLYDFASALDATVIRANVSRYVIDLNRPATGESLYPGMISTSLCPTETFRGEPLYREGCVPDGAEVARRVATYWQPYHAQLKTEIGRLRHSHLDILLWEAHSIASMLPRLFSGKLPDFNFGTSDGESCHDSISAGAIQPLRHGSRSWVLNGRFKGGFITRRYGDPRAGVHAIQLEMCQSLYMDETAPFAWREDLAGVVRPVMASCVAGAVAAVTRLSKSSETVPADTLQG